MPRRKKPINNSDLPDHEIEAIARCLFPDILASFQDEKVLQEFEKWRADRQAEKKREGESQRGEDHGNRE